MEGDVLKFPQIFGERLSINLLEFIIPSLFIFNSRVEPEITRKIYLSTIMDSTKIM